MVGRLLLLFFIMCAVHRPVTNESFLPLAAAVVQSTFGSLVAEFQPGQKQKVRSLFIGLVWFGSCEVLERFRTKNHSSVRLTAKLTAAEGLTGV